MIITTDRFERDFRDFKFLLLVGTLITTVVQLVWWNVGQTQTVYGAASVIHDVKIGEGSTATTQYFTYSPGKLEIPVGDAVRWTSPGPITDFHTVTFVLDPLTVSDRNLPFISSDENAVYTIAPPFNKGEPNIIDLAGGHKAIAAMNKDAWYPASSDGVGQPTTYLSTKTPDVFTTINATTKIVNSGVIVPKAVNPGTVAGLQYQGPFPVVNSFTVKFETPGDYQYFCIMHPWMFGEVKVNN